MTRPPSRPLVGMTVLDVSRMLPGAVAARMLADLGARVIKIESSQGGDPMRNVEPRIDGIGVAFRTLCRGVESICLDLKRSQDADRLRELAGHADVLLESFRPGTLAAWGVPPDTLIEEHPRLVVCSLSSFGQSGSGARRVAHDLNLVAASGLLSLLPGDGVPQVQIADVATGLLACSAILATLLGRERSGRGGWIDQPLSTGPLPFMTVALAENAGGGGGTAEVLLGGRCPAYRLYTCGDGKRLAVGALEPKFWARFVELLELPQHSAAGIDAGPAGRRAAEAVQEKLGVKPRDHWLQLVASAGLPVTPVRDLAEVTAVEATAFMPSVAAAPDGKVPELGEHTKAILREFGVS